MTKAIQFGSSWAAYESIEKDMEKIIEYIPLELKQYKFYSYQLSDVIVRSCHHIDSLFKQILRYHPLKDHPNQTKIAKCREILEGTKKGMLKITDYIKLFSDHLNLAPVEVSITKNHDILRPFKEFSNATLTKKIPIWWNVYNDLKHDFYATTNKATLESALVSIDLFDGSWN